MARARRRSTPSRPGPARHPSAPPSRSRPPPRSWPRLPSRRPARPSRRPMPSPPRPRRSAPAAGSVAGPSPAKELRPRSIRPPASLGQRGRRPFPATLRAAAFHQTGQTGAVAMLEGERALGATFPLDSIGWLDSETRSLLEDISAGTYRYFSDTETLIFSYALGAGPVQVHAIETFGRLLHWSDMPADFRAHHDKVTAGKAVWAAWN